MLFKILPKTYFEHPLKLIFFRQDLVKEIALKQSCLVFGIFGVAVFLF